MAGKWWFSILAMSVVGTACGGEVAGVGGDAGHGGSGSGSGAQGSSASSSGSGSSSGGGSGAGSSGSSGSSSSGGSGSASGGTIVEGGVVDAGCGAAPSLHPSKGGTIYCDTLECPTGQECCVGGEIGAGQYAPEECAAFGAACTNGGGSGVAADEQPVAVECTQIADCLAEAAGACCLQGAQSSTVAGCGYPRYSYGTAIVCEGAEVALGASSCAAGEVQVCSQQADCPIGTTCTPGKWKIMQLGFCL